MHTSRRNFLRTSAAALTFVVAGGGLRALGQKRPDDLFPVPVEAYSDPIFSLTLGQAETLVGTTFTTVASNGRPVRLTLTAVNSLERKANVIRGSYGESFSLIFEGQKRITLDQGAYQLSGGGFDFDAVLLVPTGIARDKYEIIVNHVTVAN